MEALKRVGNPHEKLKVVHVAGTNGKGSVCTMVANVLKNAGYKVGTYTSPHLLRWSDSVRIWENANCPVEQNKNIENWLDSVLDVVQECNAKSESVSLTAFEAATAAMWLHFARSGVEIAVVEAGVGGRLDATNVCPTAEASLITSVALDHQVCTHSELL